MSEKRALFLTCEHSVNTVPEAFAKHLPRFGNRLQTHEGIDFGAHTAACQLAALFSSPLVEATVTRLLIDCNRSLHHPRCFSDISKTFTDTEKRRLTTQYYLPYRDQVTQGIAQLARQGLQVLHLSVHSFVPVLHGQVRKADLGILYDPQRAGEAAFAKTFQQALATCSPSLVIRRNYPYRGRSDGLTTALRKAFPETSYLGIELEINQKCVPDRLQEIITTIAGALQQCGVPAR